MKPLLKNFIASICAVTLLAGGIGPVNAAGGGAKVGVIDAGKATDSLRQAVTKLREASVLLAKKQGSAPESEKAFRAAQQAALDAQRAMAALPTELLVPEYEKTREAKEWPVVAARLDKASIDLQKAVEAVSKSAPGDRRDDAIREMHNALAKVNEAIGAIPAASMGKN